MHRIYSSVLLSALILVFACSEEEPTPQDQLSVTDFIASIDENPQNGQIIGTVEVTGAEGQTSFSLNDEEPAGALNIDGAGQLSVADASLFDFEANSVITASVTVDADNGSVTGSITVNVNNVNESGNFNIWSGAAITFTKNNGADPALETNQDRISEDVWITRDNDGGQIYNAKTESSANKNSSPAGTKWAVGQISEIEGLTVENFRDAVGDPKSVVGKNLVLYLEAQDAYLSVTFTSWTVGKTNGGGFAYTRSTE